MGRKKADPETKTYEGDYLPASFILDTPKKVISVSPAVDMILSGGWPEGTIGILESVPKIGKTTLALTVAARAQEQYGKVVVYVNAENRLSQKNLNGVKGLDISPDKFKIISSQQGSILSTEDNLEKTEQALNEFPGCVVIFDSFSSLSSAEEKTKKYGKGFGGLDSRKLEGEFSRKISPLVLINNSIIIGIAHIGQNIGKPGYSTKVSQALLYQMDIRLSLKRDYPIGDWVSKDKVIGQRIKVNCLTSALGGPGNYCISWLKYGSGFIAAAELLEMAADLDIVERGSTGWYTFKSGKKIQGVEAGSQYLTEEPGLYKEVLQEVKSILS